MKYPTLYRTIQIDGLSIFYKEAGPKDAPTLLLLHGLPSSSRMFEPLFARLSDRYHLVAPDYPGFGHSDWPDPKKFAYTFDHIAEITNHFTRRSGARTTHSTSRTTAAPWVFVWPWPMRTALSLSSFRTLSRTMKAWERIGKRGGPFGPIAPPTKVRFGQISCHCQPRARAMSATIPTSNAMTRISDRRILFSQPARPSRHSKRPLLRLPHERGELPQVAGLDAREAAAPAGDLGQVRPVIRPLGARSISPRCTEG
jgi:pimeloyl-ACP methyl ester carboxylesterase